MITKSFQLLRTNPLLTTNIKIVISSGDTLYLESFDTNKSLSDIRYKHFIFNSKTLLEDLIPSFYKNLPDNAAFDIKYDDDSDVMFNKYDNQFDTMYYSGASNIEDQYYNEEFEYLAPLYIKKNKLPNAFIILRVDDPAIYNNNSTKFYIDKSDKYNFKSEIVDKWKCIQVIDLTKNTNIGKFLSVNINENDRFPISSFDFDIKKYNYSRWCGIDYKTGVYTEKTLSIEDKLYYENPDFNLEKFITNGYLTNSIVYPHILNLKFLFDDTPATPNKLNKWSMNRYYGFYSDSFTEVKTLTSYVPYTLKSNIYLKNNIFYKLNTNDKIQPFINDWNNNEKYYIYVGSDLYNVKRIGTVGDYGYKVISDIILDDIFVANLSSNIIEIKYNEKDGKSYIQNLKKTLIIDSYIDVSGKTASMLGDLYLINIDNKYHVLKHDIISIMDGDNIIGYTHSYYIQCDYAINSDSTKLEYWINGKNSDHYINKSIFDKYNNSSPLTYKIYKVKFSDIKDFDFDRVETGYSDFDYEKSEYYKTVEDKLTAIEYRDISNPKSKKIYDFNNNGQYELMNVSSEYISSDELFEISKNKLSDIWRKNQSICKWGYQGSISHSDYPYKLNNSLTSGNIFNKTSDIFNTIPHIQDKNLDYFYRVGNFIDNNNESIFYLKQSTNISTDLLDDFSKKFNMNIYIKSNVDYFSYFFNNKQKYYENGIYKESQYTKYSMFDCGDIYSSSNTLFKGLKVSVSKVDSFILTSDTNNKINQIITDNTKNFNDYKFSILLNEKYNRYDYNGHFVEFEQSAIYDNIYINNSGTSINKTDNNIHIILNDKFKNVLIVINNCVSILDTYKSLNNVDIFSENFGLYYNKTIDGNVINNFHNNNNVKTYNPSLITANNVINAINNMNELCGFDNYITFHYIDVNGEYGRTEMHDYVNSTLDTVNSWNNKYTPFILSIEQPSELLMKKESYIVTPIIGSNYNIYDKFKDSSNIVNKISDIDDYLARTITINQSTILPQKQQHKENITYNNTIYRFNGSYEPIFKNIDLFNTNLIWNSGNNYINENYFFDTKLENFGIINEIIYSKVNKNVNVLKLNNIENEHSIYPMIDEYGYSYTPRYIFKSCWDNDFFIETENTSNVINYISENNLNVSLNVTTQSLSGNSLLFVTLESKFVNISNINKNINIYTYYKLPNHITWNLITNYNVTVSAQTTYTKNLNTSMTYMLGIYEFKTECSDKEKSSISFTPNPPLPVGNILPTTITINPNTDVQFIYNGMYGDTFKWTFTGNNITDYGTTNLHNPIINFGTIQNSSVNLIVSNLSGQKTINYTQNIHVVNSIIDLIPNNIIITNNNNIYNPTVGLAMKLSLIMLSGTPTSYQWNIPNVSYIQGTTSTSINPVVIWNTTYNNININVTIKSGNIIKTFTKTISIT